VTSQRAMVRQSVLIDELAEAIGGRQVRAAVFTTYSFDPGFFEMNVLPGLFPGPFHQVDKVRRLQLEDELRSVGEIAVYYDRTALSQDALPAHLDFRRIDVRRATGVFHPKFVFLLVENPLDEDEKEAGETARLSLIVATLSANLTRAGWWENVEAGHIEEVGDRDVDPRRCPFRQDLLTAIRLIRKSAGPEEDHAALDRIHRFLIDRTPTSRVVNTSASGRQHTRLFVGQTALPEWLRELRLARWEWNLEVISPFFDGHHAQALEHLVETLEPKATRIYLPTRHDGSADVASELYESVKGMSGVAWGTLPDQIVCPGARGVQKDALPRRVHAKVYRLWTHNGREITLTGSVNLTMAAHSHSGAGNVEAAFLSDITDKKGARGWWLLPLKNEPGHFAEKQEREDAASQEVCIDVSFRYHWGTKKLHYRAESGAERGLKACEPGGRLLFEIGRVRVGRWIDCGIEAACEMARLLKSTSFLEVRSDKNFWRVLVREEGVHHRPSLLASFTPEEILQYWSLLSPDQKEAFILRRLTEGAEIGGLPAGPVDGEIPKDGIFARFAGIYHAFERLFQHVDKGLARGETKEAEARLFGATYDSLPVLLTKMLELKEPDPVIAYVTFLCAEQVRNRVRRARPDFWREHRADAKPLEQLLSELPRLRGALPLDDGDEFLDWYEPAFLQEIDQPEEET